MNPTLRSCSPARRPGIRWWLQVVLVLGLLAGLTGCGGKPEVTERQRKEAEHLLAEANFALTLRDWARAEGVLVRAVALVPDNGDIWTMLGTTRVRLGQKPAAREAYLKGLKAYEAEAALPALKNDPEPWLDQVYVLAVLGRVGDARALVEKLGRQFPNHPRVRAFVGGKQLDQLLADPKFKEAAL
jgi:Flp pilus assembly protein TadD